ncbi:hypothetical protein N792_07895 [Lysobacter concretionis Ko07 = DSM 16239]|uniref:ORC1/DEAH AAA+ ATPase domain-containing protein n=1 Tax=Lysobacter concretionis Ko07 = DSM 16239 TaxID=1122185 RepID=A0A0A0EP72_9GAMM|nr:hypothetical protein N792_07895 [Lysobacter concretionis Ko07 = DSM 16239]
MTSLDELIGERARLWNEHPIITESAILPTRSVQDAVARVLKLARKGRGSIAFWADPEVGKSSCLMAIEAVLRERIAGCGVLWLEAAEDQQSAEGRLLAQILMSIRYVHKVDITLAGKRDQVNRALLALSGEARHLFILIDEAQEFNNREFGWLKAVINSLSRAGVKVTTVLFGQRELKQRREELYRDGRSDLGVRFMKTVYQFLGCRKEEDFLAICEAVDRKSEFPVGSQLTYTQLLFPKAFDGGFRFANHAGMMWEVVRRTVPSVKLRNGLAMEAVASILAEAAIAFKDRDAKDMTLSETIIEEIVIQKLKEGL